MFNLKLNYKQLITLKTFYFKFGDLLNDKINGSIHELLQDKLFQYENSNRKKNNFIIKIDYEKLINIFYFIEGRFVWIEDETLSEIHSICNKKIKKYEN